MHEGSSELRRCILLIKVDIWQKSDCHFVELNAAIHKCWRHYQTLNISVSFSCALAYHQPQHQNMRWS